MSEWTNKWMDGWTDRQTDTFTGKRSVASMMKQFIDNINGFDDKR